MSLSSIKGDLAGLQEEPIEPLHGSLCVSKDGIQYYDFRPLRYCNFFEIIITPTLERCLHCDFGEDVTALTTETKDMYLDARGLIHDVDTGKNDKVKAVLTLATVKEGQKIVRKCYEGAKSCPRGL